ncbi:hypothetical protein SGRIM119S_02861 [Streptomyces griseorubiginosus]
MYGSMRARASASRRVRFSGVRPSCAATRRSPRPLYGPMRTPCAGPPCARDHAHARTPALPVRRSSSPRARPPDRPWLADVRRRCTGDARPLAEPPHRPAGPRRISLPRYLGQLRCTTPASAPPPPAPLHHSTAATESTRQLSPSTGAQPVVPAPPARRPPAAASRLGEALEPPVPPDPRCLRLGHHVGRTELCVARSGGAVPVPSLHSRAPASSPRPSSHTRSRTRSAEPSTEDLAPGRPTVPDGLGHRLADQPQPSNASVWAASGGRKWTVGSMPAARSAGAARSRSALRLPSR